MLNEIFLSRFDEAQIAQIKREQEIDKKIKTLPKEQSKLTYLEQRKLALTLMGKSDKDYLDLQNSRIILFDVEKIREARKKYIEEEMSKIKDKNMTEEQKKLKVLNDMNSSRSFDIDEEKDKDDEKNKKIIIIPSDSLVNISDSRSTNYSNSSSSKISISSIKTSREFDETDQNAKDWIKLEFFDVFNIESILREDLESESILKKEANYAFEYHNNCTTCYFAISKYFINKYLGKYELPNSEEEPRNENYDSKYGFCFCNKEIKEFNTTCSPNKMMCNECMKENMEIYGLNKIKTENNVLININGRVAFDRKDGKFRCAGKFVLGKLYYNCDQKFTCKACKLLNEITSKNYYKMK